MKKATSLFIMVACLMATMCMETFSYEVTGWKVSNTITFTPSRSFSADTIQQINDSFYKWNEASGYTLLKRSTSTHSSTAGNAKDGNSYIYKQSLTGSFADYIALNSTYANAKTRIVEESDITFDSGTAWANSAQPGCYDVFSVSLHESGHTIGLKDISSPKSAVMYQAIPSNSERRILSQDDKNGVNAIY